MATRKKKSAVRTTSDLEAELADVLLGALHQAREEHPYAETATRLLDLGTIAFEHVAKPPAWDVTVNLCLDGGPAPDGHTFGRLPAIERIVRERCERLDGIRCGRIRPPESEPMVKVIEQVKSKLSDLANARRLRDRYGKDLRHVTGRGWLHFDGARWRMDNKAAQEVAASLGDVLREEPRIEGESDPDIVTAYYRAAKLAESAKGIEATLKVAAALPHINGDAVAFDADPWALNCANGTLDLRTGELRKHRREDFLTALCPTPYDPEAAAPRWEQFVSEIFQGDAALVAYLQLVLGYALTGDTRAQVFFIAWGAGANGKSTLMDTLRTVLGPDHFHALTMEDLLAQSAARHLSPIAQLENKRLACASETGRGRKLNEARVKELTGGDPIRANLMRQDAREFVPVAKFFLLVNSRPVIDDASTGMWRRVRLLPFNATFTGERCDPNLPTVLKAEAAGILRWCADGAQRYHTHGEGEPPEAVKAATDAYRADSDRLGAFLAERCATWEYASVGATALFNAYTAWANGRGMPRTSFVEAMEQRGFARQRVAKGYEWKGIALTGSERQEQLPQDDVPR